MGREIAELARRIGRWQGIIFIDDRPGDREVDRVKVFTLEEAGKKFKAKGLEVIISVGEPATRKALAAKVAAARLQSARVIAPGFELSPTLRWPLAPLSTVGRGTCNVHTPGCLINSWLCRPRCHYRSSALSSQYYRGNTGSPRLLRGQGLIRTGLIFPPGLLSAWGGSS